MSGKSSSAVGLNSSVEIELKQDVGTKRIYFEVLVRSVLRPHHLLMGSWPFRVGIDQRAEVECLAGALGEELCERFGDTALDPSQIAYAAREAFDELMAEVNQSHPELARGEFYPVKDDGRRVEGNRGRVTPVRSGGERS